MTTHYKLNLKLMSLAVLTLGVVACAAPQPKDFGGRWKPVNRFEKKIAEVPLALPYTYFAAPLDTTLKTMLSRWTSDTGMRLQYRLRSDFTLPKALARLRTTELRDAASRLSTIYAAQGIVVRVDGPDLIVQEVDTSLPVPGSSTQASSEVRPDETPNATPAQLDNPADATPAQPPEISPEPARLTSPGAAG